METRPSSERGSDFTEGNFQHGIKACFVCSKQVQLWQAMVARVCVHVHMQASRSGDPQLYINRHVHALPGGFLQFLDFSVCLWAAGEQGLWLWRGVCRLERKWEGVAGFCAEQGIPFPKQQGRKQSSEPPLFLPCGLLSLTPSCFSPFRFLSSLLSFPHSRSHSIHHSMSPSQQLR